MNTTDATETTADATKRLQRIIVESYNQNPKIYIIGGSITLAVIVIFVAVCLVLNCRKKKREQAGDYDAADLNEADDSDYMRRAKQSQKERKQQKEKTPMYADVPEEETSPLYADVPDDGF